MTFAKKVGFSSNQTIRSTLFSRLVREMELLAAMSLNLQSGIHTLDLSQSTNQTRRVLQSADKLSQTLMCLKIALESLSCSHQCREDLVENDILDGIFLEDVRDRLLNGDSNQSDSGDRLSGRVDLF